MALPPLAGSLPKLARLSTAILVVFSFAAPAYADPIKYALVNAMFDDGGKATGMSCTRRGPRRRIHG